MNKSFGITAALKPPFPFFLPDSTLWVDLFVAKLRAALRQAWKMAEHHGSTPRHMTHVHQSSGLKMAPLVAVALRRHPPFSSRHGAH
jgi:hypothetical protein